MLVIYGRPWHTDIQMTSPSVCACSGLEDRRQSHLWRPVKMVVDIVRVIIAGFTKLVAMTAL